MFKCDKYEALSLQKISKNFVNLSPKGSKSKMAASFEILCMCI